MLRSNNRVTTRFGALPQPREEQELTKEMSFLQGLESADPEMTSSIALHSIFHFIKNNKISNPSEFQHKSSQILRICKKCDKWDQVRSIKTCEVCEDNYHKNCYSSHMQYINGKFVC